jgi:hypothetical protein
MQRARLAGAACGAGERGRRRTLFQIGGRRDRRMGIARVAVIGPLLGFSWVMDG